MRTNATTYQELDALLGSRDSRKIGNNTYAERLGDGVIGVRLHGTHVVILSAHSIVLNSGGWHTLTTKDRINTFLPYPWRLVQKNGRWDLFKIICSNGEGNCHLRQAEFYDGITIKLGANDRSSYGDVVPREEVLR